MTKKDLATQIVRQLGGSKRQARLYIDAMVQGIKVGMQRDGQVKIAGLGTFWTNVQNPRTITHPITGKPVKVEKKMIPMIKFSDEVKEFINP